MRSIIADLWPFTSPGSGRWRPLGRRRGELPTSFSGDGYPSAPIPADDFPTAHAGHLGTELRDASGGVVTKAGRSVWLCLEHDVAMWAPRASE